MEVSIISAQGSNKHPNTGIVHWLSKYGNVYSTHKNDSDLHYRRNIESRKNNKTALPLKEKKSK